MGRTPNHSVNEVESACAALRAEGRYSVGNVRDRLGGGGYAYLARICLSWERKLRVAEALPLEELIPASFRTALGTLLQAAKEEGRQDAQAEIGDLKRDLENALEELTRAGEAEQEKVEVFEALRLEHQTLRSELEDARSKHVKDREEARKQEQIRDERLGQLEQLLEERQTQRATAEERAQVTQERYQEVTKAKAEVDAALTALRISHLELVREAADTKSRAEQQGRLMSYLERDLEKKTHDLVEERQSCTAAQARAAAAEDRAIKINDLRTQDLREMQQEILSAHAQLPAAIKLFRSFESEKVSESRGTKAT